VVVLEKMFKGKFDGPTPHHA